MTYDIQTIENTLLKLSEVAVTSALPNTALPKHLPPPPKDGRIIVIGAGKAAANMAKVVEDHYSLLNHEVSGLVITKDDHALPLNHIEVREASHPLPDERGMSATRDMISCVKNAQKDDIILCLISGGGSSLMTAPADGISLSTLCDINEVLIKNGAPIEAQNCIRKHLSTVKGGQLAQHAAHAGKMHTFIISDVIGDDMSVIASGPTAPDPSTQQMALGYLEQYNVSLSDAVRERLSIPDAETPKPEDPLFNSGKIENTIIASAQTMLGAVRDHALSLGAEVHTLPLIIEDCVDESENLIEKSHQLSQKFYADKSNTAPLIILSVGEPTVTVTGTGKGGRYSHSALVMAATAFSKDTYINGVMAFGTDGSDYLSTHTGALYTKPLFKAAMSTGMDITASLQNSDSASFAEHAGALIITGSTGTNVNGLFAVICDPYGALKPENIEYEKAPGGFKAT